MSEADEAHDASSMKCKVGIHHYVKKTNDEGGAYLVCSRCGKESYPQDSAGPRIIT